MGWRGRRGRGPGPAQAGGLGSSQRRAGRGRQLGLPRPRPGPGERVLLCRQLKWSGESGIVLRDYEEGSQWPDYRDSVVITFTHQILPSLVLSGLSTVCSLVTECVVGVEDVLGIRVITRDAGLMTGASASQDLSGPAGIIKSIRTSRDQQEMRFYMKHHRHHHQHRHQHPGDRGTWLEEYLVPPVRLNLVGVVCWNAHIIVEIRSGQCGPASGQDN